MVLDVFGAESPPVHLFTAEAFARMRDALVDDGVLAVNLLSALDGSSAAPWLATYKTLTRVYPHVRAFIGARPATGLANILFFASAAPLEAAASAAPEHAGRDAAAMLTRELTPTAAELASIPVMTDDYAPLDALLAPTAHRWRTLIQQGMPEVLLR
jgi:hypothetical protein